MATVDSTVKVTQPKASRTAQAVAYYLEHAPKVPGLTPYAVAKRFELTPQVLTRRLKVLADTAAERCPCCGQIMKGAV